MTTLTRPGSDSPAATPYPRYHRVMRTTRLVLAVVLACSLPLSAADLVVYDDSLQNGFQDWSWATHSLTNPAPVAVGAVSISWEPDSWQGLYFWSPVALSGTSYPQLRFRVHGGAGGGQLVRLLLQLDAAVVASVTLAPAPAAAWEQRTIDLPAGSGWFDGVIFQDDTGSNQGTLYFDQIELIESGTPPEPGSAVTVTVSTVLDRRPVDPRIYGVNFGDAAQLAELRFPSRRWGGNSTTRYNWQQEIHNTASDWFYMNIPNDVADPGQLPDGSRADVFVDEALAAGSEPILTVPTIGWVPLDERAKKWSFSQAKYGPQLMDECSYFAPNPPAWCQADAGDGTCNPAVNTTGFCSADGLIVGNDEEDTSQPVGPSYVTAWMAHVASRVGTAAQGGPRLWALDNETMLWDSTHRDLHPQPLDYDGLWAYTVAYASAIKAQDPGAEVLGPVTWGWCDLYTSAADAALGVSCVDGPDRQAHGGQPLVVWYLDQVCAYQATHGVRLVDYLDVHFYPQGTVSGLGGASSSEDPVTAARRLRSTKELWDPSYVSESWIAAPTYLIPRLRAWVDDHCPGTGLALTEYKWGPDDGITGALAQAEVLALFGREGVDLATRWVAPEAGSLAEQAFRLYLDYDGAGGRVTGTSVRAASADHDAVGSYAVHGSDDTLYLVLVNKDTQARDAMVTVADRLVGTAAVYRFDGGTPLAATGSFTPAEHGFTLALPARSATLVVTTIHGGYVFVDDFESGDTGPWSSSVN